MTNCIPGAMQINAIQQGRCQDLFAVLGPHDTAESCCVRVYQPHVNAIDLILDPQASPISMKNVADTGLFIAEIDQIPIELYQLRFHTPDHNWFVYDPYQFGPALSETDNNLLVSGQRKRSDEILGANLIEHYGIKGVHFAVWAPNAARVSLVGHFNGWDARLNVMRKHPVSGIWEIFMPELAEGEYYKFDIIDRDQNQLTLKSDPYASYCQPPPESASIVWRKQNYQWNDGNWLKKRASKQQTDAPISIYEVHLGSWRRSTDESNGYLSYQDLALQLAEYVSDLGYTHVQLLPIAEYPFDGSWGYQPVSLFAPTSRFGDPNAFKFFVDHLHQQGIGVLLDWVPAHFPGDEHGLAKFDGTHLYEHADPRKGFHQDWNTCIYNYGRVEVCNFLIDSACYWLDEYHIDGLRVDAVASMLYLNYSRKDGEWIPNIHGGNENLEAVEFIRRFNEIVYAEFKGVITIAEESTSWPGVTHRTSENGLGFGYKWNMGWMHDTLGYLRKESIHRKFHHHDLTFGLLYAFSENFVLPLSHDEVVHGKGSLINKMAGDNWQKFANLRAYFALMWTYPGKKLLFMGNEFAQFAEWNHDTSLDWHLLEQLSHQGIMQLIRDLNRLYTQLPALYEQDCDTDGFRWIDADNNDESVYVFARFSKAGDWLVVVCNFTPMIRSDFRIGVFNSGQYREILNTDSTYYGGSNVGNLIQIESENVAHHGLPFSLSITLPPLSTCVFEYQQTADTDVALDWV